MHADVVVIGAGGMGSSAAWRLARAGRQVVLLERFERGHAWGSSHGATRIFRVSYRDPLAGRLQPVDHVGDRAARGSIAAVMHVGREVESRADREVHRLLLVDRQRRQGDAEVGEAADLRQPRTGRDDDGVGIPVA